VQRLQVRVDGADQVVVHRDRQVVLVQVRLAGGLVAAGACVQHVQVELTGQRGGECVLELAQRRVERVTASSRTRRSGEARKTG